MPRVSLFLLPFALIALACTDQAPEGPLAPEDPSAGVLSMPGVTVMTQNMYLGANIDLLLTASTPADVAMVFDQLFTTTAGDFARAAQMALEIVQGAPHLVGLQEVTRYTFVYPGAPGPQVLDFLGVLMAYLDGYAALGYTPYTYAAYRNPLTNVTVDAGLFGPGLPMVTYQDGDAVLVRNDVELMGAPEGVVYDAHEVFDVAGVSFDNVHGYQVVTARAAGETIRFVNTHLEVQRFEATQVAQAEQLIAAMEDAAVPVVMVGDFNSAANHDAPDDQMSASYHMFRQAGFSDLWLREPGSVSGVTCCQAPDLTNPDSELSQRLDLVLVRYGRAGFGGQSDVEVVGDESGDRVAVGALTLWPSDHAGVLATFWPAPGQRKAFAD